MQSVNFLWHSRAFILLIINKNTIENKTELDLCVLDLQGDIVCSKYICTYRSIKYE